MRVNQIKTGNNFVLLTTLVPNQSDSRWFAYIDGSPLLIRGILSDGRWELHINSELTSAQELVFVSGADGEVVADITDWVRAYKPLNIMIGGVCEGGREFLTTIETDVCRGCSPFDWFGWVEPSLEFSCQLPVYGLPNVIYSGEGWGVPLLGQVFQTDEPDYYIMNDNVARSGRIQLPNMSFNIASNLGERRVVVREREAGLSYIMLQWSAMAGAYNASNDVSPLTEEERGFVWKRAVFEVQREELSAQAQSVATPYGLGAVKYSEQVLTVGLRGLDAYGVKYYSDLALSSHVMAYPTMGGNIVEELQATMYAAEVVSNSVSVNWQSSQLFDIQFNIKVGRHVGGY